MSDKYSSVPISQSSSCPRDRDKYKHVQQPSDISFALKYLANNKPFKTVLEALFNNFRQTMVQHNVSKTFSKAAWSID